MFKLLKYYLLKKITYGKLREKYKQKYKKQKLLTAKISHFYSQYGEDIILSLAKNILLNKKVLDINDITYIDIGCNRPKYCNNTYWLYLQGANGILIEPNKIFAKTIRKERPEDTLLEIGIANVENDIVKDFYQFNSHDGLSTFSKEEAEFVKNKYKDTAKCEIIPIKVRNINHVLDEYLTTKTPFLMNIDVEGLDYEIISSLNLKKYRPVFFVIETTELTEAYFLGHKIYDCVDYLKQHGYVVYADTYINTILIDKDMLEKMY